MENINSMRIIAELLIELDKYWRLMLYAYAYIRDAVIFINIST